MCFASLATELFRIASDLGVRDSNRIAHCGRIARFGPLRTLVILIMSLMSIVLGGPGVLPPNY